MGSNTKTYVVQNGCHIGDDVTETHFRDSNVNLSFYATKRSFINTDFAGDFGWGCCVYAEDRGFKLRLTPASTLEITNMVFSGVDYVGGDYSVDLSGDGSKTFNIGAVYRATKFIVGNSSLNRFAFYDCYEIDIDATTVITESSVESSKSTGKGVYFSDSPDDYSAIQIRMSGGANDQITVSGSSAGTYDLGGITATNSVNFHNESATNAVTILLAAGVSYTTSTAGGAITVETPPVSLTINGLIAGGVFSIFDNEDSDFQFLGTKLLEVDPVVGTSVSYTHAGVPNDVIIQFLADGYEETYLNVTLTNTSQTFTLQPSVEENL